MDRPERITTSARGATTQPTLRLGRREVILGALGAALLGCDRTERRPPRPQSLAAKWQEISFAPTDHYPHQEHAVVLAQPSSPLLVALHGRGEAGRGVVTGARGWRDDYDLDRAHARLGSPPLKSEDLLGFVKPERLAALNASLQKNAYGGLCVACPYTPALADRSLNGSQPFASFVLEDLIPRVRKTLELPTDRSKTGIDGVSMGGRLALQVGLAHPEVFGAVGALQPAIGPGDVDWIGKLAAKAQATAPVQLRLVTSEGDYFRQTIEALSQRMTQEGVKHELLVTPGPHDYAYNRGPGSFEMLLWHDRVLRGLPPP